MKRERFQINNSSSNLQKLKKKPIKSKISRIRAEIGATEETRKSMKKQKYFFEIIRTDKPLARLLRRKRRYKLSTSEVRENTSLQILQTLRG